jgi:hypothetical protein
MNEIDRLQLKNHLNHLLDEILDHHGFGEIKLDIKWAKIGCKEIIVTAGKQYRFILPVDKKKE